MRIVLDTNVFVSGVYFNGPPCQILEAWRDGKIQLVLSPDILDEYGRVAEILADEHPGIDLKPMLDFVVLNAEVFSAAPLPDQVSDDPSDDKFLACTLAGGCNVIVSGDKHLLKVTGFQGVEIMKPRDFVNKYLRQ